VSSPYGSGYADVVPGGGGCLTWFLVLICIMFGFMVAGGGDGSSTGGATTTTTSTVNRTGVELMSRNQVNLWSDVQNCYGDGSCPTTIVSNTTSAVAGDRSTLNVQAGDGGLPVCLDPTTGAMTSSACQGVYANPGGQP
jgi:hypothetical protein